MKNKTFRFVTSCLNRALLALSLIGLLTSHANSQTTTLLSLRVKVVDTEGNLLPGARVVLKPEGNDQEITAVTTTAGTVTITNLQPGSSKMTVMANGFETSEQIVT